MFGDRKRGFINVVCRFKDCKDHLMHGDKTEEETRALETEGVKYFGIMQGFLQLDALPRFSIKSASQIVAYDKVSNMDTKVCKIYFGHIKKNNFIGLIHSYFINRENTISQEDYGHLAYINLLTCDKASGFFKDKPEHLYSF